MKHSVHSTIKDLAGNKTPDGQLTVVRSGRWLGKILAVFVLFLAWGVVPRVSVAADMTVYKSPSCGCCGGWVTHMESSGFSVEVQNVEDVYVIKEQLNVPPNAASCHTAKIGGYVIEGHVPAADIRRLLKDKPKIDGIAAPGMPMGSPGMEVPGEPADKYNVVTFSGGKMGGIFATH